MRCDLETGGGGKWQGEGNHKKIESPYYHSPVFIKRVRDLAGLIAFEDFSSFFVLLHSVYTILNESSPIYICKSIAALECLYLYENFQEPIFV